MSVRGLFVALALVLVAAHEGEAKTSCQPTQQGPLCISQVDFAQFAQQAFMSQLQSEWCWAASISMLFSYYGHPVKQARIVADVYGAPENIPAQAGIVIANELNRCWQDDNGSAFSARLTGAYDAQAGVHSLSNSQIVSELDQDHPLILGARGHAIVLTAIQYYQTSSGPYIVAGGVFDPWPGRGARALEMDELTVAESGGSLTFAATSRVATEPCSVVSPSPPVQPAPPGNPQSMGSVPGCNSVGSASGLFCLFGVALFVVLHRRVRRVNCRTLA